MSAGPPEPPADQLTIIGLEQRLAGPWQLLAHRAHAVMTEPPEKAEALGEQDRVAELYGPAVAASSLTPGPPFSCAKT